jgi:N6-L-threonylcarbamoyladenine synthase
LLSGGHTELVLVKEIGKYKIIGQTRDDAVGEAYDKVARMLGLSYPGGPEISKLSEQYKPKKMASKYKLPRPMLNTPDYDFSFSGLKTAVLYTVKNIPKLTPKIKQEISYEFEQAVVDVLLHKTKKAIEKYKIKTLILGGGVVANKKIRENFQDLESEKLNILIPDIEYTGDNATMVAIAGYFRYLDKKFLTPKKALKIKANGNMNL